MWELIFVFGVIIVLVIELILDARKAKPAQPVKKEQNVFVEIPSGDGRQENNNGRDTMMVSGIDYKSGKGKQAKEQKQPKVNKAPSFIESDIEQSNEKKVASNSKFQSPADAAKKLREELQSKIDELDKQRQQNKRLGNQLEQIHKIIEDNKATYDKLQKEFNDYKKSSAEEKKKLQQQIKDNQNKFNQEKKSKQKEHQVILNNLQVKLNKQKEDIKKQADSLQQKQQAQIKKLSQEIKKLTDQVEKKTKHSEGLNQQLQNYYKQELENGLKNQSNENTKEQNKLKKQIQGLTKQNKQLREQNQQLKKENTSLTDKIKQLQKNPEVSIAQDNSEELKKASQKMNSQEKQIGRLAEQIKKLQNDLEIQKAKNKTLSEQNQKSTKSKDTQTNDLRGTISKRDGQIQNLSKTIEDRQQYIDKLQRQLNQQKNKSEKESKNFKIAKQNGQNTLKLYNKYVGQIYTIVVAFIKKYDSNAPTSIQQNENKGLQTLLFEKIVELLRLSTNITDVKIEEKEKQIQKWQEKYYSQCNEKSTFETQLKTINKINTIFYQQFETLISSITKIVFKQDEQASIQKLLQNLSQYQNISHEAIKNIHKQITNKINEKISSCDGAIKGLGQVLNISRQDNDKLKQKIKTLQEQINISNQEKEQIKSIAAGCQEDIKTLKQKLSELAKQQNQQRNSLTQAEEQKNKNIKIINDEKEDIQNLKKYNQHMRIQLINITQLIFISENQSSEENQVFNIINGLTDKNYQAQLEKVYQLFQNKRKSINDLLGQKEGRITTEKTEKQSLEKQLKQITQKYNASQGEKAKLIGQKQQIQKEFNQKSKHNEVLSKKIELIRTFLTTIIRIVFIQGDQKNIEQTINKINFNHEQQKDLQDLLQNIKGTIDTKAKSKTTEISQNVNEDQKGEGENKLKQQISVLEKKILELQESNKKNQTDFNTQKQLLRAQLSQSNKHQDILSEKVKLIKTFLVNIIRIVFIQSDRKNIQQAIININFKNQSHIDMNSILQNIRESIDKKVNSMTNQVKQIEKEIKQQKEVEDKLQQKISILQKENQELKELKESNSKDKIKFNQQKQELQNKLSQSKKQLQRFTEKIQIIRKFFISIISTIKTSEQQTNNINVIINEVDFNNQEHTDLNNLIQTIRESLDKKVQSMAIEVTSKDNQLQKQKKEQKQLQGQLANINEEKKKLHDKYQSFQKDVKLFLISITEAIYIQVSEKEDRQEIIKLINSIGVSYGEQFKKIIQLFKKQRKIIKSQIEKKQEQIKIEKKQQQNLKKQLQQKETEIQRKDNQVNKQKEEEAKLKQQIAKLKKQLKQYQQQKAKHNEQKKQIEANYLALQKKIQYKFEQQNLKTHQFYTAQFRKLITIVKHINFDSGNEEILETEQLIQRLTQDHERLNLQKLQQLFQQIKISFQKTIQNEVRWYKLLVQEKQRQITKLNKEKQEKNINQKDKQQADLKKQNKDEEGQIGTLNQTIKNLNQQIESKNKEITQLSSQIKESQRQLTQIFQNIDLDQVDGSVLENTIKSIVEFKNTLIIKLKKDIQTKSKQHQEQIKNLKQQIEKLSKQQADLKKQNKDEEGQIGTLKTQNEKLTKQLADLRPQIENKNKQIDNLKDQIANKKQLQQKIQQQGQQITSLAEENSKDKKQIATLNETNKNYQDLQQQLKQKVKQIEKQQKQNEILHTKQKQLNIQISQLSKKITQFESVVAVKDDQANGLKISISKNTKALLEYKKQNKIIQEKQQLIQNQSEQIKWFMDQIERLGKQVQKYILATMQVTRLLSEVEQKNINIQQKNRNIQQLKSKILQKDQQINANVGLTNQNEELKMKIIQCNVQVNRLQNILKQNDEKIKTYETKIQNIENQIEKLRKDLQKANEKITQLDGQKDNLENKLIQQESDMAEFLNQLEIYHDKNEVNKQLAYRNIITKQMNQIKNLQKILQQKEQQLKVNNHVKVQKPEKLKESEKAEENNNQSPEKQEEKVDGVPTNQKPKNDDEAPADQSSKQEDDKTDKPPADQEPEKKEEQTGDQTSKKEDEKTDKPPADQEPEKKEEQTGDQTAHQQPEKKEETNADQPPKEGAEQPKKQNDNQTQTKPQNSNNKKNKKKNKK